MNNFIIYALETAISLALFYSAYWIFLRKETFFKLNRSYLVGSVLIALLTPLLNIKPAVVGEGSFITRYIILPVQGYEQRLSGEDPALPAESSKSGPKNSGGWSNGKTELFSQNASAVEAETPVSALNTPGTSYSDKKINWLTVAAVIYFSGVVLFLIRFLINLVWIFTYVLRRGSERISGMKIIRLTKSSSPFSFLNFIFINQEDYSEAELKKIISHEKIHIQQHHSVDLILLELVLAVQWFNPFVWYYKRAIKVTHEYLADEGTLNSGVDLPGYQYSLLNQALGKTHFEITSSYNGSIKNRITMMEQKRSSRLSTLKLGVALPVFLILFSAFAFSAHPSQKDLKQNEAGNTTLRVNADSTVKKVAVSAEYLKLLEGDYISTDEPNRVRKIRFAVVVGDLIGNDHDYVYKLIPVGGEKFINPDDNAVFVFDSRDKDAIRLLLFGRINLKKVKPTRRSTAFSTTEIITKEGIAAALSQYKRVKDSSNYYLSENEMNYAGYQLLQAGKTNEAAAVFKLNTEAFPKSFNVYDSYGEALMALGDKNKAIENYKKAVQINPGSLNSIKVLKEAGVYADTLIKKVPGAYLALLEGTYVSTNEPGFVRTILFKVEEDGLTGNDNGYHYKLIPVGGGKFINPDDGASFVFDTKDKNSISLLLFGKVNLIKTKTANVPVVKRDHAVKKVDVSGDYLQLLVGEYVSTNAPNRVRTIRFEEANGELVGDDAGYVYRAIPVGDGKFINPDDGESLVFDTKDKNAISLLLFGKINLKKVK